MGFNLDLDVDNKGKLSLAMQGHLIPTWVYANSQIEHENKRIRLSQIQQTAVLDEAKQRQRRKQRTQQHQEQVDKESQTAQTVSKWSQQHNNDNSLTP